MSLRKWQSECAPLAADSLAAGERALVYACTGAGKTRLCAAILERAHFPVVIAVPTIALVAQTSKALADLLAEPIGVWSAAGKRDAGRIMVVCHPSLASLPESWRAPEVALIADECHRSEGGGFRAAAEPYRAILGLTATPYRADELRLSLFQKVLYTYSIHDATRDGVLVPFSAVSWHGAETDRDTAVIQLVRGLTPEQLPVAINANTIEDSEAFAGLLAAEGIPSAAIHSRQSQIQQRERLRLLEAGELSALVYPSLLSEGVDLPWLRSICFRRAVGSRTRITQELGRVLRVHPGKTRAWVLDPLDLLTLHSIAALPEIGASLEPGAPAEDRDLAERAVEDDERQKRAQNTVSGLHPVEKWAAICALLAADLGHTKAVVPGRAWRLDQASAKQLPYAGRGLSVLSRLFPSLQGIQIERRGFASDLISLGRVPASFWAGVPEFPSQAEIDAWRQATDRAPAVAAFVAWTAKNRWAAVACRGASIAWRDSGPLQGQDPRRLRARVASDAARALGVQRVSFTEDKTAKTLCFRLISQQSPSEATK